MPKALVAPDTRRRSRLPPGPYPRQTSARHRPGHRRCLVASLQAMAGSYSTAAVSMGHLALKRAIRFAAARDLGGRNVAELSDTPPGQPGRPSRSLTSTRPPRSSTPVPAPGSAPTSRSASAPGSAPRKHAPCTGTPSTSATRAPLPPSRPTSRYGGQCAAAATPRPSAHAAPCACPHSPPGRYATCASATAGTPARCSPPETAANSTPPTSAASSAPPSTPPASAAPGQSR